LAAAAAVAVAAAEALAAAFGVAVCAVTACPCAAALDPAIAVQAARTAQAARGCHSSRDPSACCHARARQTRRLRLYLLARLLWLLPWHLRPIQPDCWEADTRASACVAGSMHAGAAVKAALDAEHTVVGTAAVGGTTAAGMTGTGQGSAHTAGGGNTGCPRRQWRRGTSAHAACLARARTARMVGRCCHTDMYGPACARKPAAAAAAAAATTAAAAGYRKACAFGQARVAVHLAAVAAAVAVGRSETGGCCPD
jgi:hypothetical protein